MNVHWIHDHDHQISVIVVDHSRSLVDSKPTNFGLRHRKWRKNYNQFQEKGKENYCLNLRKRKIKTQILSKVTRVDDMMRR